MKQAQESFLVFLDNQVNTEENFQNLINILDNLKIREDHHKTKSFLYLIVEIANNHYRYPNFFSKIDKVLQLFKGCIQNFFSNSEIFNIFHSNKRVLLFLFNEQILQMDQYIINKIRTNENEYMGYPQYFAPEIKSYINENWIPKRIYWIDGIPEELPENFYENRERGESESELLKLIREDSIIEFISYTNSNEIDLHIKIDLSIYETNSLLIEIFKDKQKFYYDPNYDHVGISLISYAAFFGSFRIFNYLLNKGASTHCLWEFAIHGANMRIFRIIENDIDIKGSFYDAIKNHNNNFALFIRSNYLQYTESCTYVALQYHNFYFVEPNLIDNSLISTLCWYEYNNLVEFLLKNGGFDINEPVAVYEI
ncbi:hypothetical protein M9Y10_042282 [Tritrichomonas musculus]|uniref:DUF3447 domain-containing protein n=1 Tax=Tritrichomonas musculus TaxID=1915356 RepID=A0ABR2GR13_9EUKA